MGIIRSGRHHIDDGRQKKMLRRPGIEPGSTAWKAAMLTTIPPTRCMHSKFSLRNQGPRVLPTEHLGIS